MAKKQPTSLSTNEIFLRLLAFLTLGNLLLVTFGAIWVDHAGRKLVQESETHAAGVLADGISSSVTDEVIRADYDAVEDNLRKISCIDHVAEIVLLDPTGKIMAHLQRQAPGLEVESRYHIDSVSLPTMAGVVPEDNGDLLAWRQIGAAADLGWVRIRFFAHPAEARLVELRKRIFGLSLLGTAGIVALILISLRSSSRAIGAREGDMLGRQQALQVAATHDPLTGLPNRVALFERLPQAIKARVPGGQPLAICFLDLDGFKAVNDRWGHDMGDALLIAVARRLEHCLRDTDMVARLAGDEFVLILDGEQQPGELHRLLERVVAAVGERVAFGSVRIKVGCSIGVMLCTSADADAEVMLHKADEAMYEAKRKGRNRWVIHEAAIGQLFTPMVLAPVPL